MSNERICDECGEGFVSKRPWGRFCGARCRVIWWDRHNPRTKEQRRGLGLRERKKRVSAVVSERRRLP